MCVCVCPHACVCVCVSVLMTRIENCSDIELSIRNSMTFPLIMNNLFTTAWFTWFATACA